MTTHQEGPPPRPAPSAPLVEIRFVEVPDNNAEERVEVWVDGDKLCMGWIRCEPEDNCRARHYDWIEKALARLAERLGARVIQLECERTEEEDLAAWKAEQAADEEKRQALEFALSEEES